MSEIASSGSWTMFHTNSFKISGVVLSDTCSPAGLTAMYLKLLQKDRSRIHERIISLKFPGIILGVLKIEISVYNVDIKNQFQTTFAQGARGRGGGGKIRYLR
jgi:hypothetical protein